MNQAAAAISEPIPWRVRRSVRMSDAEWANAATLASDVKLNSSQAIRGLVEIALHDPELRERLRQHYK